MMKIGTVPLTSFVSLMIMISGCGFTHVPPTGEDHQSNTSLPTSSNTSLELRNGSTPTTAISATVGALSRMGGQFCTATLVAPQNSVVTSSKCAVTAVHCDVAIGDVIQFDNSTTAKVTKIDPSGNADVAVLTLNSLVSNGSYNIPTLATSQPKVGSDVTFAGTGSDIMGNSTVKPMMGSLPIYALNAGVYPGWAGLPYSEIELENLGSPWDTNGVINCAGDSGGPLFDRSSSIVGVLSTGQPWKVPFVICYDPDKKIFANSLSSAGTSHADAERICNYIGPKIRLPTSAEILAAPVSLKFPPVQIWTSDQVQSQPYVNPVTKESQIVPLYNAITVYEAQGGYKLLFLRSYSNDPTDCELTFNSKYVDLSKYAPEINTKITNCANATSVCDIHAIDGTFMRNESCSSGQICGSSPQFPLSRYCCTLGANNNCVQPVATVAPPIQPVAPSLPNTGCDPQAQASACGTEGYRSALPHLFGD